MRVDLHSNCSTIATVMKQQLAVWRQRAKREAYESSEEDLVLHSNCLVTVTAMEQ